MYSGLDFSYLPVLLGFAVFGVVVTVVGGVWAIAELAGHVHIY